MPKEQLQQIRQLLAAQLTEADLSLQGMRNNLDAMAKQFPPVPGVETEVVENDAVKGEWFRPAEAEEGRAILFIHGGGYMIGSIDSHRDLTARVAVAAKAPALSIHYRRAPEHPFPAAHEDVLAAYGWLLGTGVEPGKLAVVGDSAGAGLALSLCVRARDDGDVPLPGALALMSPWVDLECESNSLAKADDPVMTKEVVQMMAKAYVGEQDPRHPLISPLHADLSGLPPILVQVGGAEALHDEGEAFAERARAAGTDIEHEVWDDMFHAWHLFALMLDEGQQAIEKLGEFVRKKTS